MNSKIKFYQSIQYKIALVFVLMLILTLEIVGALFVRQLEHENLNNFKQQIELPSYVENSLTQELVQTNTKTANRQINSTLQKVENNSITEIRVVDAKGIIRGTSNRDQNVVGQKANTQIVKNTLVNNRSHSETVYDNDSKTHYYVTTIPLMSGNTNNVVGVVYIRASLESVYNTVTSISLIYLSATVITIIIGLILSIIISREITRPIEEMRKQTLRIARGDFSGRVKVNGNDELGQLSAAINNLSNQPMPNDVGWMEF